MRIALLHAAIAYGKVDENRKDLLDMISRAAGSGANLIVAPEMALPGYSFDNREAIAPFVETIDGPTVTAVGELAQMHGVYVCVGLALEEPQTGIFHNSAVVVDPDGKVICRYNKINAESRWACPGDSRQDNTFPTPWGRIGLLICSDSYYGLMPRITALRGADLLLVPANWPPTGLDPCELWRARAMENGIYLAACNRTGIDRTMDCRQAVSCAIDPNGRILLNARHADSQIFTVDLPLTEKGRLDDTIRWQRLAARCPDRYNDCYLNLRPIQDLTPFLNLPSPDILDVYGVVPEADEHPIDALLRSLDDRNSPPGLFLLPRFAYADEALNRIGEIAAKYQAGIITCRWASDGHDCFAFPGDGEMQHWPFVSASGEQTENYPWIDFGSARLKPVPFDLLAHPENGVAAAKQDCDLMVSFGESLDENQRLQAGVRTIEHLAVACSTPAMAGIWLPPDGHQRWEEQVAGPGAVCHVALDTHRTRQKRFQDNIDFDTLLKRNGAANQ